MNGYTDHPAKMACETECAKRNAHISKHHPMRWKPLWDSVNGWKPALRPSQNKPA